MTFDLNEYVSILQEACAKFGSSWLLCFMAWGRNGPLYKEHQNADCTWKNYLTFNFSEECFLFMPSTSWDV